MMKNATRLFLRLPGDESGATAIEYGLIAALIAVTIIAAITATGTSLAALYAYWSAAVIAAL